MKKNNLNNNIGYESPTVLNWLAVRTNAPILQESEEKKVYGSVDTGGQEVSDYDFGDINESEWQ